MGLPAGYCYKPLPCGLRLDQSDIQGYGIHADRNLPPDTTLGISHIHLESVDKSALIRTPLGGYLNHSDTPNCKLERNNHIFTLITLRWIKPDEEITINYNLYMCGETICDETSKSIT